MLLCTENSEVFAGGKVHHHLMKYILIGICIVLAVAIGGYLMWRFGHRCRESHRHQDDVVPPQNRGIHLYDQVDVPRREEIDDHSVSTDDVPGMDEPHHFDNRRGRGDRVTGHSADIELTRQEEARSLRRRRKNRHGHAV